MLLLTCAAFLLNGCGAGEISTGASPASPSPAPAWLSAKAALMAANWGDPHPTAAFWGLLRDPELGRLTSSGPDDPSHEAYAVILVGDYSKMYGQVHWPVPPSSPLPPIKWIYAVFTTAHDSGGSGFSIKDFEATQFPSLQPLSLPEAEPK